MLAASTFHVFARPSTPRDPLPGASPCASGQHLSAWLGLFIPTLPPRRRFVAGAVFFSMSVLASMGFHFARAGTVK